MHEDLDSQELAAEGSFPASVRIAALIWLIFGGLIVLNAAAMVALTFAAAAAGQGSVAGGLCTGLMVMALGLAFLYVGMQTIQSQAQDTLGNGLGSLGIGAINGGCGVVLLAGALATGETTGDKPALGLTIAAATNVLASVALLVAGVLALVGRRKYLAWQEPRWQRRPKRLRERFGRLPKRQRRAVRCPACGQKALPRQALCSYCHARLNEVQPVEDEVVLADETALPVERSLPLPETAAAGEPVSGIIASPPGGIADLVTAQAGAAGRACPGCGVSLSREAVLCVQCGYDFRLGKARGTVVQKAKPDRREVFARDAAKRFPNLVVGLTLYSTRILLSLLATLLILGLSAFVNARHTQATSLLLSLGLLAGVGLWLLSVALGLVGSILCLRVPAASLARLPLVLALLLDTLTLPLGVIAALLEWPPLLSWITGVCSWAFFVAFLMRLAAYIDRPSEVREGRTLLVFGLILIVLPILMLIPTLMVLSNESGEGNPMIGAGIAMGLGISGLLYLRVQIILLRLLETLRESLRQHIEEVKRQEESDSSERALKPGRA